MTPIPIDISSLPHLQHLTIRGDVTFHYDDIFSFCFSFLPAAVEILKTASSLQYLTLQIYVSNLHFATLGDVDFSPLVDLPECRHIEFYLHSDGSCKSPITHTEVVSTIAYHESLKELMERGVLVVHDPEETGPTFLDMCNSRSTIVQHPRLVTI